MMTWFHRGFISDVQPQLRYNIIQWPDFTSRYEDPEQTWLSSNMQTNIIISAKSWVLALVTRSGNGPFNLRSLLVQWSRIQESFSSVLQEKPEAGITVRTSPDSLTRTQGMCRNKSSPLPRLNHSIRRRRPAAAAAFVGHQADEPWWTSGPLDVCFLFRFLRVRCKKKSTAATDAYWNWCTDCWNFLHWHCSNCEATFCVFAQPHTS